MDRTRNGRRNYSNMAVNDLTLEEMFAVEKEHPPLVGSRTSVFLEPSDRATARTRIDEFINAPAHEPLTDREHEVLRLVAAGKTQRQIASDLSISVQAVKICRARLREKLDLRTIAQIGSYTIREKPVK